MYDFKRTIRVQAIRLDATSKMVLSGMGEAGDWLVFDGDAVVVKHSEFVTEYVPSGKDASAYAINNSSPIPGPAAVPPGAPPRAGSI